MNVRRNNLTPRLIVILGFVAMSLASMPAASAASPLTVADGDVAGLIAAIETANMTSQEIHLAENGTYTLTESYSFEPMGWTGLTGLPIITGHVQITGNNAWIRRQSESPDSAQVPEFRIFSVAGTGHLSIDNAAITGGEVPDLGGGIFNLGRLVLTNTYVSDNSATHYGGGIYSEGDLILDRVNIQSNSATTGGGITANGPTTITRSSVIRNTASGSGGGVTYWGGDGHITDTNIYDNSALYGGGIELEAGHLVVQGGRMIGNAAGWGGAIYNGGTFELNDAWIASNSATSWGGGAVNIATMVVTGSAFTANVAENAGGILNAPVINVTSSIVYEGATLELINSTLSANGASDLGGGLANWGKSTLTNVTVSRNTSSTGGGIYASDYWAALWDLPPGDPYASVAISNTLIGNNHADTGPDVMGLLVDGGYNLLGIDRDSIGLIDGVNGNLIGDAASPLDPRLRPLTVDGGPTPTHALLSTSPAIDAIPPDAAFPSTDQRGVARPQGAGADIGAFELMGRFSVSFTLTDETGRAITPESVMLAGLPVTLDVYIDATIEENYLATIEWGDGVITTIEVVPGQPATAQHVFTSLHTFDIDMVATSDSGNTTSASQTITIVGPVDAIRFVVTSVRGLSVDPELGQAARPLLESAIADLEGNNATAQNGALQMLEMGNQTPALVKLRSALEALIETEIASPTLELSEQQALLALTGKAIVLDALIRAEPLANNPGEQRLLTQAGALITSGDSYVSDGDFAAAVRAYQQAVQRLAGIR